MHLVLFVLLLWLATVRIGIAPPPQGEDVVSIGAVIEYGATIHHPNGATIIIPARPFLHPVMEQYREEVADNYRKAIRAALTRKFGGSE